MNKMMEFLKKWWHKYDEYSKGDYIIRKKITHLIILITIVAFSFTLGDDTTIFVQPPIDTGYVTHRADPKIPEEVIDNVAEHMLATESKKSGELYLYMDAYTDGWSMHKKDVYEYEVRWSDSIFSSISIETPIKTSNDLIVSFTSPDYKYEGVVLYTDVGEVGWVSSKKFGYTIGINYPNYETVCLDGLTNLTVKDKVRITILQRG